MKVSAASQGQDVMEEIEAVIFGLVIGQKILFAIGMISAAVLEGVVEDAGPQGSGVALAA